ncbi:kinase-like protein [Aaosphaeria arxii CBS 175.79]|uniref:Kinase-like protein n=1 Tax=Aaosphaeria arxii CBS 175.79 TaxID=1450172 RepID=A0A6A5X6H9_9PLEO|nr:kinase-like protein [Aaosphaeria arxii CBS 175.79]KAF2008625.1 kinase-like protein [Aaosphaeria arxii CBS 175.79]
MESPDNKTDNALRRKWCLQMAQALAYVHKKGIIHSNISDTNVLVHETNQTIDLLLADFGGSKCVELSLNGHLLPDIPFGHPDVTDFESPSLDVFSLGVLFYVIVTGHYPFHEGPAPKNEEHLVYYDYAEQKYEQGEFPDLSGVMFGDIIAACCCERRFTTADHVIDALCAEMQNDSEDPGRDVASITK